MFFQLHLDTKYPDTDSMYEDLLSISIQIKKGQKAGKSEYGTWVLLTIYSAEEHEQWLQGATKERND
jgi:hypothetical protein